MNETESHEIELTPDLLEYAKAVAITEAEERCPDYVEFDDLVQEVWLKLLSKPVKYDPTKGADVKTLLYTVVQRIVLKHIGKAAKQADRFQQVVKPRPQDDEDEDGRDDTMAAFKLKDQRQHWRSDFTTKSFTTDDILEFIDDEESRELCTTVMECEGNMSEASRQLGVSEGTVRYRFKMLLPKLQAAGFDPYSNQEFDDLRL